MVAEKWQPPRVLAQFLEEPQAGIARRAAIDQITCHDDQVRIPGLDMRDTGLHGREVGLDIGKNRDPHEVCSPMSA